MTDIDPAQPGGDTRRMLVVTFAALALIVIALIFFVWKRDGADGTLPGTHPTNRENPGAGGGGSVPAGSNPGGGSPASRPPSGDGSGGAGSAPGGSNTGRENGAGRTNGGR